MKLLVVGHGRMGRLVESLAPAYGFDVAGIVTSRSPDDAIGRAGPGHGDEDLVAVDFTTAAAVPDTIQRLADRRINVVIGTTGWQASEPQVRRIAERAGIGVLASANFSVGMAIFRAVVREAARRFAGQADVGAWLHETHHAAKKDAPSGTALMLKSVMGSAGYDRPIDVSSTRAGSFPGTHAVGFDAPAESVTLTHEVRDRAVFARGALEAARWLRGRRGWFTIEDLIGT